MKRHVVLIGLPGSGKSTVGRLAAERLQAGFVDIDTIVERREGRPIAMIFAELLGIGAVVIASAGAARRARRPTVVACFLGDGAVEEGVFHESLNFAALKSAPILFVCENNAYAIHSRQAKRQSRGDICARSSRPSWCSAPAICWCPPPCAPTGRGPTS